MLVLVKLIVPFVSGSDHLRDVFTKQMGLTDQDIVALSGGHTLVCVCCILVLLPPTRDEEWYLIIYYLILREDATRSDLDLRDHGLQTPSSLTTLTSRKEAPLLNMV